MRALLVGIAMLAAGAALVLQLGMRSSYSSYSGAQLDLLDEEYRRLKNFTTVDQDLSHELLRQERQRRLLLWLALGACGLSAVGAIFARGSSRRASPSDEEKRLLAALGDPKRALEGARHKAAALLGVTPDAPAAVVEAALAVQLKERDEQGLDGLAPDLQAIAREQRAALQQARDLLLGKQRQT